MAAAFMDSKVRKSEVHAEVTTARALHDSEENFRLLVSSVQDYSICLLDIRGHVANWNIGAERMTGYSADEVVGHHSSIFYTPDDITGSLPQRELAATRVHGNYVTEGWRLRSDGSRFYAQVVITLLFDDANEPRGFAVVTRDISTRKQMDERFRLVVESAPSAMVMINESGKIEMVNAQAERVFGYSRSELLGRAVEMLVPERFRKHHPQMRKSFYSDPQSRPMGAGRDLFGLRKDGSEFPVEIGLNPIETEQGPMVLSAIVDISDRKQKEESIKKALAEKDILLGEIHHRVKNNLQIVHSLLDLQCTQIADPVVRDMLKDSQNRIRSMAIIHQTLYQSKDFAAIEFKNVLDLIGNSLLASYGVDDGHIQLSFDAMDIPLSINKAIPCGLIVNELVTNSLKHAFVGRSRGSISISFIAIGDMVELSVVDDGIGIAEHIDLGLTGTLGLQLINLLAEQIGGKLEIKRANPTRFSLRFSL
ncbi:MAG: histidine kinase [Verrucomicrobiaceae bacterium]|nr:histidine kinase [Verrucomicrobiaceae bacterium]